MDKEQQKDKIIEIIKKAIGENSLWNYDKESGEFIAQIDGDDVDHIAEEVAGNIYNFYHPIDEVAEYKPTEERCFSDYGDGIRSLTRAVKELKDERDEYYAQADRLQEKLAQVLMRVDITKEWTLDRAKIEGAKEFAEKLKEKFDGYDATSYNGYEEGFHDLQEEIGEVLKEYTE